MIIDLNNRQSKNSVFRKVLGSMALLTCLGPFFTSCNDSVENLLTQEYPAPSVTKENKGKVLWIVLDGANGEAVRQTYIQRKAENIRGMLTNAFYSFDGLADTEDRLTTDSIAWNNLMIASSSKENIKNGQSVLSLMKSQGKSTALFANDEKLHTKYEQQSDAHFCGDDGEVTDKAVASLSADETKDFTIVELGGVKAAGEEHGYFDESNNTATPELIQAIHVADTRVGIIMKALKARKNYAAENWLVMVTSNDGGIKDWDADNVYDRLDRKTFTVMYNQNVVSTMYQRPSANDAIKYEYYTLRYNGVGDTECATVNDPSLFNFTYDSSADDEHITNYTVQFMYIDLSFNTSNKSETLVSKAMQRNPKSGQGWSIERLYNRVRSIVGGTKVSADKVVADLNNKIWNVVTVVYDYKLQKQFIYVNGVLSVSETLKVDGGCKDVVPLTIGKIMNSPSTAKRPFYINNLQIYDVALPADWIAKNYKMAHIDKKVDSFKYWDNLIGYWPGDREEEYNGSVLHDYSKYGSKNGGINSGKSDMTITNPTWVAGASAEKNISPFISDSYYQKVINTKDLTYQSLQWMGISIDSDWKLSGIGRAFTYIK